MALMDTQRFVPASGLALATKPLIAAVTAVISWNDTRMTRNALSKLTSRELEDIGIIPGDIDLIGR